MDFKQVRRAGAIGVIGTLALTGCGGGSYGSSGGYMAPPPAMVTLSASPTTINLGQSVTLTWSSNAGTSCSAAGAWSGAQAASGSQSVTPTATGTASFTIGCAGGIYGNGSATAKVTVNAASAFSLTSLVADTAGGAAAKVDANLVNAWGVSIAAAPATNPAWVANNHSETSTLYDGTGTAIPLVVNLPPNATTAARTFDPTGIIFNTSATSFMVTVGATSGVSKFIFDGEGGMIAGWAPNVDLTHAVIAYSDAGGAVYKGLAVAAKGGAWFLYATDFHNGKVDVFDSSFAKQATSATAFTFSDPGLPAGYAPFGIQAINNGPAGATQIYVTYARARLRGHLRHQWQADQATGRRRRAQRPLGSGTGTGRFRHAEQRAAGGQFW
jgi:hypothetical protein